MRCAPAVSSDIDQNLSATIHLVKLLCEVCRIAIDAECPNGIRESIDCTHVCLTVQRDGDVESFGSRRLYPAWQAEFVEQVAKRKCGGAQHAGIVYRWIQVEHVRRARSPYVGRDAVLVDKP